MFLDFQSRNRNNSTSHSRKQFHLVHLKYYVKLYFNTVLYAVKVKFILLWLLEIEFLKWMIKISGFF